MLQQNFAMRDKIYITQKSSRISQHFDIVVRAIQKLFFA